MVATCLLATITGCGGPSGPTPSGSSGPASPTGSRSSSAGSTGLTPSGSASAPGAGGSSAAGSGSGWAGYHGDPGRSGYQPTVTVRGLQVSGQVNLDGAVYGQPVQAATRGGPVLIAATERDSVYGLRDGRVLWHTGLGTPVPLAALPCGNIDPSGITGSPVVDPATGSVLVAAELNDPLRHEVVALDPATGAVRWRRGIDQPGVQPAVEQQRAALAVSGGRVWVALGGLYGDCGQYHGYVIGVPTSGSGAAAVYRTPSRREAGIWAPSGPAVGPDGHLYVAVGNGEATSGAWDHSDAVLELDTSARVVSEFAPAQWAADNAADLDLGSMGPLVLPRGLVLAAGKRGEVYLLRQGRLGGVGHPVATWSGCKAYGGAAAAPSGADAITVVLPCRDGLAAVRVDLAGGGLHPLWRAPDARIAGSPVITGGTVLAVDQTAGQLVALDLGTGRVTSSVAVGPVSRFATPMLAGHTGYLPTLAGLTQITLS